MKLFVVSCNNQEEFGLGEKNMWEQLAQDITLSKESPPVLHLGGQAYGCGYELSSGNWSAARRRVSQSTFSIYFNF